MAVAAALLVACGGGDTDAAGQSRAQSVQPKGLRAVGKPDATALFDWAEGAYQEFFPSHRNNEALTPWVYRFYPETGNYVGVSGDTVAVLGPVSGGSILVVGTLSDFSCRVYPSDCSAPGVVVQPTSQVVTAPAAATFSVVASGAPEPTYQWQSSRDNGSSFTSIAGATLASYTTPATSSADNGTLYRVVLGNSAGSFTSDPATLTAYADVTSYTFVALSSAMTTARAMHTATTLADGKVLIAGGFSGSDQFAPALDSAELYDPATDSFTPLGARMRVARIQPAAVRLPDGKVLITGGQAPNLDGDGIDSAEIYDPATQTFSLLMARMASPRGAHTATLLNNGKVLLTAGFYQGAGSLTADAELYDPLTQTFTALTARMIALREEHKATLLPDGTLLISGGKGEGAVDPVKDLAEQFDPATGTFSAIAARMSSPRVAFDAARLPGGKVVLMGGASIFDPASLIALSSAESFDPATRTFAPLSVAMTSSRVGHAAALLANGSLLVTGGIGAVAGGRFHVLNSAELFRDATGRANPSVSVTVQPTSIAPGGHAMPR